MYDHVTLRVSDFGASRAFYEAALAPLGIELRAPSSARAERYPARRAALT
jgi:catechol 2,3-dioxygenase-like lactoylglutathione lyase family enzyme